MSLPRARLADRLAAAPLLADGGMGTLLFSRGIPQRACLDELATSRPDLVATLHREYLDAGADMIETLTFGANRLRLDGFGLAPEAGRINRRAAQVAREARDVSGRDAWVGGSIGPLGPPTRELRHPDDAAIRAAFREQIDGLLEGGVDLLVIETFFDLHHLALAVDEARAAADVPVIASMTFGEDLVLADGTTPAVAVDALTRAGVDAIGVNCGVGPLTTLDALAQLGPQGDGGPARSIMPNAGLPQRTEGRFVYAAEPAYFASMVPRMLDAGARILGGCCGTTPAHIAAMRAALDALDTQAARRERARVGGLAGVATPLPVEMGASPRTAFAEAAETGGARGPGGADGAADGVAPRGSRLAQALADGRFVISVEIDPPRSIRIHRTLEAARLLRDAGTDVVNVSDSAMARVRMGAMAVAFGIQHDLDLECVVHVTTRDRNLMALESELLGAHALGVRNILALTGDPPRVGDYPTGTGVWDVDSIGLIEILTRLNRGEDQAGSAIGQQASFAIACALDPTAADSATEWDRLERKLAAGAQLVMTQPLYDEAQVEAMFAEARRRFGPRGFPVPVLLGVLPLVSSRHAEFLHNEVPGITIPDAVRARMRDAGAGGTDAGIEMADRLLAAVESESAGTYLMPSFGRYEQAAEVVRRIRARHPAPSVAPGPHAATRAVADA
ncbi:MAG TPA: bifunctional homocysteine S-methyltransferase/methylenetetrahydrofolate reductase [Candidatus Limnocylindrales bacterium]|nr:bifunctional homocysteine S-methyltransferase/methylenetetrahydrofolate reductase [Candidatus Limnocylindrales bacterium]